MSKNILHIYLKEAADYRRTIIYWSLAVIFLLLSGMSKYQGYAKANVSMNKLLKGLPPVLSAVFGLGKIDLSTVGGYFAVMALYLSVLLGVQAVLLGAGIIAKEERDKTAEFLFSKPVSRRQVLIAKLTAAVGTITILNIVTTVASLVIVNAFINGPAVNDKILLQTPGIYFIQLIFLVVGFFLAAITRRPRRSGQAAAAFLLAAFITSSYVDVSEKNDFLKYFTPFKYFDSKKIYTDGGYSAVYIVIALLSAVILAAISLKAFNRRDLNV